MGEYNTIFLINIWLKRKVNAQTVFSEYFARYLIYYIFLLKLFKELSVSNK